MATLPTKQTVMVTFGPESTLIIDKPVVHLGPDEWIEWQFPDMPSDHLAYIRFEPLSSPLGPFQSLSLQGRSVTGMGNSGQPGPHAYEAMVLDAGGLVMKSQTVHIDNQSAVRDTSPEVIVQCDLTTHSLTVNPSPLKLQIGQTATWHVFGVPADHFVTFRFPHLADLIPGPFSSFFLSRRLPEEATTVSLLACGEGYGCASPPGDQIEYRIAVRNASGIPVLVHDPLIDTLGDPPTPVEES